MDKRITWIIHEGKEILFLDYSNLKAEEMVEQLGRVEKFYESDIIPQGKKDLLILSDVKDARIFGDALDETKRVIKKLRPYSKKSAMVGLSSAKTILLKTINFFAGDKKASKQYASLDEAKAYLVS